MPAGRWKPSRASGRRGRHLRTERVMLPGPSRRTVPGAVTLGGLAGEQQQAEQVADGKGLRATGRRASRRAGPRRPAAAASPQRRQGRRRPSSHTAGSEDACSVAVLLRDDPLASGKGMANNAASGTSIRLSGAERSAAGRAQAVEMRLKKSPCCVRRSGPPDHCCRDGKPQRPFQTIGFLRR